MIIQWLSVFWNRKFSRIKTWKRCAYEVEELLAGVTSLLQCWGSNINIRCVRYFLPIHTVPSLTSFFEFRTISDGQMLECAESLETFLAKTWCFGNMRLSKIEVKPGSPPMLVIPWLLDSREFPGFAML